MKQFETKLTVRIYDTKLVECLNTLFKRNKNHYQTKNQLIVELLELGIMQKLKELQSSANSSASAKDATFKSDNEETVAVLKQIKEMIADMHIYNKKHVEGLLAHLKMSERLTSSIYNLLLAVATDEPVTKTQVELGYFDDVPDRFVKLLAELISEFFSDDESDSEDITGKVN